MRNNKIPKICMECSHWKEKSHCQFNQTPEGCGVKRGSIKVGIMSIPCLHYPKKIKTLARPKIKKRCGTCAAYESYYDTGVIGSCLLSDQIAEKMSSIPCLYVKLVPVHHTKEGKNCEYWHEKGKEKK